MNIHFKNPKLVESILIVQKNQLHLESLLSSPSNLSQETVLASYETTIGSYWEATQTIESLVKENYVRSIL